MVERTPKDALMARTRRTPKTDWRADFLKAFATTGTVKQACEKVGIGRRTAYDERQRNEDFALAWHEVEEHTTEAMEREAIRRGLEGVEEPVFYKGAICGAIQKYSDTLLIFMLKSRKPDVYREVHHIQHSGGVNHQHTTRIVLDAELAEEARGLLRRSASPSPSLTGGAGGSDQ